MSDVEKANQGIELTEFQVLRIGIASGLVLWIILAISIVLPSASINSIEELLSWFASGDWLKGFFIFLATSIIGAFVSGIKARKISTIWIGALIAPLLTIGLYFIFSVVFLCCQ